MSCYSFFEHADAFHSLFPVYLNKIPRICGFKKNEKSSIVVHFSLLEIIIANWLWNLLQKNRCITFCLSFSSLCVGVNDEIGDCNDNTVASRMQNDVHSANQFAISLQLAFLTQGYMLRVSTIYKTCCMMPHMVTKFSIIMFFHTYHTQGYVNHILIMLMWAKSCRITFEVCTMWKSKISLSKMDLNRFKNWIAAAEATLWKASIFNYIRTNASCSSH